MSSQSAPSKRLSLNIYSPTGPKPLHLVDGTTSRNLARAPRRQSSISYKRSSNDSPARFRSLDEFDLPSRPLHDETREAKPRPGSVAYSRTPLSSIPRDRRSLGPGFSPAGLSAEHRPPLTLAEKHADLLRFIAQKESKCLELRSQLAMHETELLQLKRKWERIISRGFESPHSFSATSSPASSTTHSPPATYTSTPSISAPTPNSATNTVIEGIKEGVQGVSRLFAASLSITNGDHPHSLSTNSADATTTTTTTTSATTTIIKPRLRPTPTPLKPRERPHSLYFPSSHSPGPGSHIRSSNLSTSSTCTTTTSGTRFSAASPSSASSFFFEEGPERRQEHNQGQEPPPGGSDEKAAEQGQRPARQGDGDSDRGGSPYSSSSCSQELIVRDTGATPTVCPNPKFRFRLGRRKERERERRKEPEVGNADGVEVQLQGRGGGWSENENESLDGVSILGGLGIEDRGGPAASSSAIDPGSTCCHRRKSREASSLGFGRPHSQDDLMDASNPSNGTSSEAGPIVPIASHNENGKGIPSWTSRGWGSATFTKSQKRASLLFSDVSQTLASAFSRTSSAPPRPPLTTRGPASAAVSLLDQDDEDGGFLSIRADLEPMKPIVVGGTLSPGQNSGTVIGASAIVEDDDMDWGW